MNLINHRDVFYVRDKGITLIALVITVIVLIILAGIAISMLSGDNGILNQVARAKEQTEAQSTLEQVKLATTAAIANENRSVDEEILEKDITSYGFEISHKDEENNYTVTKGDKTYEISNDGDISEIVTEPPTEEVTIKTKFIDSQSENKVAVIPEGFKVSSVDGEQQIDTGLVVIAPDESEFVWIPVENPNSMYGIDKDGIYLGKLYNFKKDGTVSKLNWKETEKVMVWLYLSQQREPDCLGSIVYGDASTEENKGIDLLKNIVKIDGENNDEILNKWEGQLQNEFKEMALSVEDNKGFYIGRYETSENEAKSAQSIREKTSLTAEKANTWYGLYQIQKEYSEKNNLSNFVGSSMIWGSQYDQVMIWMQNNGIDVTTTEPATGATSNTTRITGTEEADKLNNIYDILGCNHEWTLEAQSYDIRVYRRWYLE